jgi:O-antigen ligase
MRSMNLPPRQQRKTNREPQACPESIPAEAAQAPYWNLQFEWQDWVSLAVAGALCVALHTTPVLHSGLAVRLIFVMAAVSYLSPISGFFYLACCQYLPFPEGASFNPAQVGVLVWLPVVLVRYQRLKLTGLYHLLWVAPWLVWHMLMTGENVFAPKNEYMKAMAYSVIACQLASEAKGQYLKCLLGLACGALLVTSAYWGLQFGLPMEISEWGGARGEFVRMGGVRADAVMVWPAVLIGLGAVLGLGGGLAVCRVRQRPPKWLLPCILGSLLFAIPPLIATMTHGAFAGLFVILAVFAATVLLIPTGAGTNEGFRRRLFNGIVLVSLAIAIGYGLNALGVRSRTNALATFFQQQSEEMGMAASRTGVWSDAFNTISRYPLTGYIFAHGQEIITTSYDTEGSYLAHNVFLDYGRYDGIPGMVLLLIFFFRPAAKMLSSRHWRSYLPFLLAFVAAFIFWMSLSFQFYKTVWGLWMLMTIAVADPAAMTGVSALVSKQRSRWRLSRGSREEPASPREDADRPAGSKLVV